MLGSWLVIVPRTLLGLLFLTAAADGFSYLLRGKEIFDPPLSAEGKDFLLNLKKHRAFWTMKASVDLVGALMLIANFHAPLAVLLLLPSAVVILVFQLSINKIALPVAAVLAVLMGAVGAHYLPLYAPLLQLQDGLGPLGSGPYGHPAASAP
jgi:hypothetical protein